MDAVRAVCGSTTLWHRWVLASMQRENATCAAPSALKERRARHELGRDGGAGAYSRKPAAAEGGAVLEAVIAAHPDYAEAYNSLGVILTHMGRHEPARVALRKVLELDPTSAKAYENLAVDELSSGELAPAVADLRRALDLDPRLYDALYNLAQALLTQGRRDEARPFIERFVREAPPARYAKDIERFRGLSKH
jgi:Flp pilus assembly protein TadD